MGLLYESDQVTDTVITTTAETVVCTLSGVASQRPGQKIRLHGSINITPGTATTGYTLRVREDSLTGAVVGELETDALSGVVGTAEDHEIVVEHVPAGELSNKSYVLTVAPIAATGNATVNHANLKGESIP